MMEEIRTYWYKKIEFLMPSHCMFCKSENFIWSLSNESQTKGINIR